MGKSSKKSATKVDATPVVVPQSGKKGKRGAENEIEKLVSAKKQKVERDETVVVKQKVEKKLPKKAASSSSDDDSDDSDSDSEPKVVAKKIPTVAKNGSVVAKKSKGDTSSDSSDSSGSDSDEKPVAKKQPAAVKNGSVAVKKASTSDSSSSESDSDEEKPAATLKNGTSKDASSSEESDSDNESSEEEEKKKVAAPPAATKGKVESSDSDSDEEEDSSDSDEEPKANKAKGTPAAKAGKPLAKQAKADSSSSEGSSDDDSSDDEPSKVQPVKKVQASSKSDSSSDESDEDESDEEENKKESLKTPKKKDTDVEMVDADKSAASTFQKTPKTPATPEATGSKTLFVGNLSFSVEESDVREFFKEAGEVVDIRFASNAEGQFRGFGHVEFATAEEAQKAMELHDQPLLNRPVRLDLARERDNNRSAFTPQSRENNSFQKGGGAQGQTAFVRGFDTSLGEDEIRSALQKHFESCGEITRISIPKDFESGGVKGMAYMDFADSGGFNTALEKDGSDLGGGYYLNVQEAKPRGDSAGGSGRFERGGRSGGRRGGRDGGRFSGRGGRDGGRFSGRGGRDGGRGRGRGTPYKASVTAMASGKKTTFGDD